MKNIHDMVVKVKQEIFSSLGENNFLSSMVQLKNKSHCCWDAVNPIQGNLLIPTDRKRGGGGNRTPVWIIFLMVFFYSDFVDTILIINISNLGWPRFTKKSNKNDACSTLWVLYYIGMENTFGFVSSSKSTLFKHC